MPLYIPIIIFGSAAAQFGIDGLVWTVPLASLVVLSAIAMALCPVAIAGILRLTTLN
jgi:heme exporter protein B